MNKLSWDSWALINAGCLRANLVFLTTWTEKSPLLTTTSRRQWDYQRTIEQLDTVQGIGQRGSQEILVEIGPDAVSRFADARHLSSWAKVCPGNNESAGKHRSGRSGRGNRWLRSALVESAWAAIKVKGSYYSSLYRRLAARRGSKRAILAVAHAILETIYSMLKNGTVFHDLGDNFHDLLNPTKVIQRVITRIERLGYKVVLEKLPAETAFS